MVLLITAVLLLFLVPKPYLIACLKISPRAVRPSMNLLLVSKEGIVAAHLKFTEVIILEHAKNYSVLRNKKLGF